jgi:homoserine/homoserine lactone efflux protein
MIPLFVDTRGAHMIEVHLYIAFVAAVIALMLLPGPNIALITANSVSHGVRCGLLTVAGTSSAMVVQLAVRRSV